MTRYFGIHTLEGEWHSLLPRYALLADRIEGKQILDIGCGSGIGSSLLLELGAQRVNGIDHRPEVLELARVKHAKQGLDFHVMFWEELDFPDDSFDMVLCLDPSSPVTDPSLLREIKRVLRPGGEYICAIERRNVEGMESLLPRYGYPSAGEDLELTSSTERVPQLGELEQLFETMVSVVQRPRYSFVFDFAPDSEALHTMRRSSAATDESGLWVGDSPHPEPEGSTAQTDSRPGRWISIDQQLTAREGESAAVELLFCGDEHMPPPTLKEIQMPYRGLVDRLHQLFSDLQLRQHPDQVPWQDNRNAGNRDEGHRFEEREETSEFQISARRRPQQADNTVHYRQTNGNARIESSQGGEWRQVREQLDRMTRLYEEVRAQMEDLFIHTRQEIAQRDRYIEQLVDTVHSQRHNTPSEASEDPFERSTTQVFKRGDGLDHDSSSDSAPSSEETPGEELDTDSTAQDDRAESAPSASSSADTPDEDAPPADDNDPIEAADDSDSAQPADNEESEIAKPTE